MGAIELAEDLNEYHVRNFRQGDEIVLVDLFNRVYKDFAGFVPRTPEYWVWCCLSRPDVNEESVVIANNGEKTVGYAVVGKSGNVWELCYDPDYNGKMIVSKLLNWILDHLESIESDSVVLNAPVKDKVVREVCQELDFAETPPEFMFVSVFDLPSLICEILRNKKEMLNTEGIFWFRLKGCPSWYNDNFCIQIQKNEVSVREKIIDKPELVVDADMPTLVSCILGNENILKAIITSKVHLSPFWKIRKFLKLFSLLRIKSPWFTPKADGG
jgi:hypothetical protein